MRCLKILSALRPVMEEFFAHVFGRFVPLDFGVVALPRLSTHGFCHDEAVDIRKVLCGAARGVSIIGEQAATQQIHQRGILVDVIMQQSDKSHSAGIQAYVRSSPSARGIVRSAHVELMKFDIDADPMKARIEASEADVEGARKVNLKNVDLLQKKPNAYSFLYVTDDQ